MNYRTLYTKLDNVLARIEHSREGTEPLHAILEHLIEEFHDDLGLLGARLYERREDEFVLTVEYPEDAGHVGYVIPAGYEPVQELVRRGFVIRELGDPGVDLEIEQSLGVRTFAGILVGETNRQLVAFTLADSSDRDHVVFTLNTIRHAINLKLRKQRLENRVAEVREIQASLLPAVAPRFHDFDLWGRTLPAEEVGGDAYDFLPVSERSLGILLADSAGHGLPAALQARDAIIGMRMGVEERLRITATIEKLNRVVSRSALSTRFISLFYAEIEPNGNLVYCNAGHNPPLLRRMGETFELRRGGLVLGPNPDAQYERGYMLMPPGSALLLYTDGIVEAADDSDEMFGVERLEALLTRQTWRSAQELVELVFEEVGEFSPARPPIDDQTVVALIRHPADG